MNMPSIRQLQYLLALVELCHFGKAASRCFVTQSTLSTGIQELEHALGIMLFERTKRKVIPTPMGLKAADTARQILKLSAQLLEDAQSGQEPLTGALRMGIIPTIGPFLLPKVLPALRQSYSKLELYLVEDQTKNLIDRLNAADLDCAILALPYEINTLESFIFHSEMFWIALPKNHQLALHEPIPSIDLPADELLLLEEGHCLREHVLSVCHRTATQQKPSFQGTSLYTLIEMVSSGLGITFLPAMALGSNLISAEKIALRALAETGPHRNIALVWRATYPRKGNLKLLGKSLRELTSA